MAASKSFSIKGASLDGADLQDVALIELLQNVSRWQRPLGIYVLQPNGHTFRREDSLSMEPLLRTGKIAGIQANIQGLKVGLLAAGTERLDPAFYRPGKLIFEMGSVTHTIQMCWEDALAHIDITLRWHGSERDRPGPT
jgi:hypothetical protein